MVWQPQIKHAQSHGSSRRIEASVPCRRDDLEVLGSEQFNDAHAFGALSSTRAALARRAVYSDPGQGARHPPQSWYW